MVVYDGNDWEIRMCSDNVSYIGDATKIPFVKNWSYEQNKGIEQVSKGMGYGPDKEVHETQTEISGSLEKGYCETALQTQSPFTGSTSPFRVLAKIRDMAWFLQFKNTITNKTITFSGVHFDYSHEYAEDDFGTETADWQAETVTET